MLKQNLAIVLMTCLMLTIEIHGKHFHSLEEDLTGLINRAIEFAKTGAYKPYHYTNSKLLKNIFTKLMYKAHVNELSRMDRILLVYLIIDIGRKKEDANKMPVFWYSRQGR